MKSRWTAVVGLVLVLVLGVAKAARADVYTDENRGFSMNVPKGWRAIPIANEEDWIVAKWLCDREYADPKEGTTHTPDLKVILFPHDMKRSVEVEKTDDGVSQIHVKNPYKSYKDYVKSDGQGGRYVSKEEDTVVNGIKTTWYEVKYEKLTTPRRAIAFMYHTDDVDYLAQYELLESQWDKLSPGYIQSLKSFKVIPRKASVKKETTGGDVSVTDTSKMTPEEKAKAKAERFERNVKKATERLTEGWTVKRSKNYVAITHVDDKYTSKVLEQAEAIRAWCEANFGYIGDGYVQGQILRICVDDKEQRAFTDTSSKSGWVKEIVLSRDDGAWGFRHVNSEVMDAWFADKNPKIGWSMPPWLQQGLSNYVHNAVAKGSRLEFPPDTDEVVSLKVAAKGGKLMKPREILLLTYEEIMEKQKAAASAGGDKPGRGGLPGMFGDGSFGQMSGFTRYLIAGPGSRNPRTKDLLKNYLKALVEYVEGDEKKTGSSSSEPQTEEEEEKRFKERQSEWKQREKETLQAIFDKAFAGWTDADWTAFDKSYVASVS